MAVPTKAKDAAPTITNFNIESPAATNDKSRTNLTLLRPQQTDSRASNSAIFFDECCGNSTQLCSRSPREALVFRAPASKYNEHAVACRRRLRRLDRLA